MTSVISFLIIVSVSVLITRIAAILLFHTGLSRTAAKFQARSAFTGVGFTTNESESITSHPFRRKIVLSLMLLGNAGFVSAISSLVLTFTGRGEKFWSDIISLTVILATIGVLYFLSRSRYIDHQLEKMVKFFLKKLSDLKVRDYNRLLNLSGDYEITEMKVQDSDWISGKTLADTSLRNEGIIVLGIERPDGTYLGVPHGDNDVSTGDILKLYGRDQAIKELIDRDKGWRGDYEHKEAQEEQKEVQEEEQKKDEERKEKTQGEKDAEKKEKDVEEANSS